MHETASSPLPPAKKDPAQNVNSDEDGTGKLPSKTRENEELIVPEAQMTKIPAGKTFLPGVIFLGVFRHRGMTWDKMELRL